jgi:hypothetical protein
MEAGAFGISLAADPSRLAAARRAPQDDEEDLFCSSTLNLHG